VILRSEPRACQQNEWRQDFGGQEAASSHEADGVLEILPRFELGLTDIEGLQHVFRSKKLYAIST
jgi:tRNA (Thr-GGU) A37 N-methylase